MEFIYDRLLLLYLLLFEGILAKAKGKVPEGTLVNTDVNIISQPDQSIPRWDCNHKE